MLHGLPPNSATARIAYGGRQWGPIEELLATLAELTDHTNRLTFMAGADKKDARKLWDPLKIPRPYEQAQKKVATADEARAYFKRETSTPEGSGKIVVAP